MRKIIDWDEAMSKLYAEKNLKGFDPYNLDHAEIFEALEKCFNENSENGWNLLCFIDDKSLPNQYGFLFEKSKDVYDYSVVFLDVLMENDYQECMHNGTEFTNKYIADKMNEHGIVTPMYIHSLRYLEDADGKFTTLPIYICRKKNEVSDERKKLYAEYQVATKKNAVFRGSETKAFKTWLITK